MARQPLFPDTDEQTERVLIELVRRMPDWKKFQQIADLTEAVRELAMLGLRDQYPQASEEELRFRFAAIVLGRDLAGKVCGRHLETEMSR
jgi:hypothetical protein